MLCSLFKMRTFVLILLGLACSHLSSAQGIREQERRMPIDELDVFGREETRVVINTLSHLRFGSFYPGRAGGMLEVSREGIRSSAGTVVLLGSDLPVSSAVYEIRCPPYTMIHLMVDDQIILRGPGNEKLICIPDINGQMSSIVSPHDSETGFLVTMGARLIVESAGQRPPGDYSGSINVFLVVE